MKPINRAEAKWKFWRPFHPTREADKFSRWAKRMMRRVDMMVVCMYGLT